MTDREPPQDVQAEQALLASMMTSPEVCADITGILTGPDFYRPAHEAIFEAITNLDGRRQPADPITVAAEMGRLGTLERSGGRVYLAEVFGQGGIPGNAAHYAQVVRDAAGKRRLIEAAIRITQDAYESAADAEVQAENARALFDRAMPARVQAARFADLLPSVVAGMESGTTRGRSTGWTDLDRLVYGLRPGSVYVVGARPAVGKSLLALHFATVMWDRHDLATYFASLEMTSEEVIQRSVASRSRVPLDRIITGTLTEQDWAAVSPSILHLQESRVHIADSGWQTIGQVRTGARTLARRQPLGLVVIDYLQLLAPRDPKMPREQQVAEASRGAKLIAKELDVPVVLLSQLNRATGDHGIPTLANLRESGAIEQDADVVMLMHRPDEGTQQIDIHVAKNRSGPTGICHFHRQGEYARLIPAASQ